MTAAAEMVVGVVGKEFAVMVVVVLAGEEVWFARRRLLIQVEGAV